MVEMSDGRVERVVEAGEGIQNGDES